MTLPCRASRPPAPPPYWPGPWYGRDPRWTARLETGVKPQYGGTMSKSVTNSVLTYEVPDLEVVGRDGPTHVTVRFHRHGGEETYGLDPRDFPKVYTAPVESPHRYPDGALCLFYPLDPPSRRWRSTDGLDVLLTLVANHLFAEDYWSATGGPEGGEWVLDEAPHGFPSGSS